MSIYIPQHQLEHFLAEDVPYNDVTSDTLGLADCPGQMECAFRQEAVVCGTEEAGRLAQICGCRVEQSLPSGTRVDAGDTVLRVTGNAAELHRCWRTVGNLLEYVSGIATRTHDMVQEARGVNPGVIIAATRKIFPGTKALVTKGVLSGGGQLHRLGLSETLLVFDNHRHFLDPQIPLVAHIEHLRRQQPEKQITVEAKDGQEALDLARLGVDAIQVDKLPAPEMTSLVNQIREISPRSLVVAAGGIDITNVATYAATGVDILVTSNVYHGPPADLQVRLQPAAE